VKVKHLDNYSVLLDFEFEKSCFSTVLELDDLELLHENISKDLEGPLELGQDVYLDLELKDMHVSLFFTVNEVREIKNQVKLAIEEIKGAQEFFEQSK